MSIQVLVVTLWWLGFWTALGLCLGSFLNVVIHRLPHDQSLREPLWSACPYCRHRIRWYDNLPILSFILLRGQCRDCRAPIATRYLVIEASMALVVLMLVDAFMVANVRTGLCSSRFGLTDQLAKDWPILLAHVVLFACLISMSAIDLEHYWVDVRFTNLATIVGFALHAIWTPRHGMEWVRPGDTTAVMSILALVGLGIVWLVFACQPHMDGEDAGDSEEKPDEGDGGGEVEPQRPRAPLEPGSRLPGFAAAAMLAGLFVWLVVANTGGSTGWQSLRALVPLAFFFYLITREGSISRPADDSIMEAIEEERHGARGMVLGEFAVLVPALALAVVGFFLMQGDGEFPRRMSDALHAHVRVPGIEMMRTWSPLYGLATAASGYVVAGAAGWAIRIIFTAAFGKEAFGTGDIHLMAAAGCVAGWPVVMLGFLLTCGLAVAGWLISLPFKRARAIPLGPWMSLSFLVVVIYYDAIIEWPFVARVIQTTQMLLH